MKQRTLSWRTELALFIGLLMFASVMLSVLSGLFEQYREYSVVSNSLIPVMFAVCLVGWTFQFQERVNVERKGHDERVEALLEGILEELKRTDSSAERPEEKHDVP